MVAPSPWSRGSLLQEAGHGRGPWTLAHKTLLPMAWWRALAPGPRGQEARSDQLGWAGRQLPPNARSLQDLYPHVATRPCLLRKGLWGLWGAWEAEETGAGISLPPSPHPQPIPGGAWGPDTRRSDPGTRGKLRPRPKGLIPILHALRSIPATRPGDARRPTSLLWVVGELCLGSVA